MIREPPRATPKPSSAASDGYKGQASEAGAGKEDCGGLVSLQKKNFKCLLVCLCVRSVCAAVRLSCAAPFVFSEFLDLRFARGGAPRSIWKKKSVSVSVKIVIESAEDF